MMNNSGHGLDNEDQYRIIVEIAQEGIWMIDENHQTYFVNQKMTDMLGYTQQELMGRDPYDFMEDGEKFRTQASVSRHEKVLKEHLDIFFITKSGARILTSTSASFVFDQYGIYKGIVNMVKDVTDHKALVEAIKESEAKFRSFFENSMDGFLLTVPAKGIIAANPAACSLFQLNEKEIREIPIQDLFKFADHRMAQLFQERDVMGKAKGEVMFKQKDGTEIPGEVTTVLFKDALGNERSSIIIRDISNINQRIIAEKTLQKSEANLKTIFNNTDVAYILVDASMKVVSFNDLAKEISLLQGYEVPAEGSNIMDYFAPERKGDIANA